MTVFTKNQSSILTAINNLKSGILYNDDELHKTKIAHICTVLNFMEGQPQEWDSNCTFNISMIGGSFISKIGNVDVNDVLSIEGLLISCYRFICEYDFHIGFDKSIDSDLIEIKHWVIINIESFLGNNKSQILYATYEMPSSILKFYLNSKEITDISQFNAKVDKSIQLKSDLDSDLDSYIKTVDDLKSSLDEYETGFNFVALSKGFSDIYEKRVSERDSLLKALILMSLIIIAPLFIELINITLGAPSGETYELIDFLKYAPIIPLEIILLYYFRILLSNFNSVKAQLLQIELRMTLCRFIQSYASYSSEINSKSPNSLEKFENLIFSGILSESERIPSTFDGLEQISNFIKSARKP